MLFFCFLLQTRNAIKKGKKKARNLFDDQINNGRPSKKMHKSAKNMEDFFLYVVW